MSRKRKVKVLLRLFCKSSNCWWYGFMPLHYVAIPWPFSQCFRLYLSRTTMKLAGKQCSQIYWKKVVQSLYQLFLGLVCRHICSMVCLTWSVWCSCYRRVGTDFLSTTNYCRINNISVYFQITIRFRPHPHGDAFL